MYVKDGVINNKKRIFSTKSDTNWSSLDIYGTSEQGAIIAVSSYVVAGDPHFSLRNLTIKNNQFANCGDETIITISHATSLHIEQNDTMLPAKYKIKNFVNFIWYGAYKEWVRDINISHASDITPKGQATDQFTNGLVGYSDLYSANGFFSGITINQYSKMAKDTSIDCASIFKDAAFYPETRFTNDNNKKPSLFITKGFSKEIKKYEESAIWKFYNYIWPDTGGYIMKQLSLDLLDLKYSAMRGEYFRVNFLTRGETPFVENTVNNTVSDSKTATTITSSGDFGFATGDVLVTANNEYLLVNTVSVDKKTITVTRGFESTTISQISANSKLRLLTRLNEKGIWVKITCIDTSTTPSSTLTLYEMAFTRSSSSSQQWFDGGNAVFYIPKTAESLSIVVRPTSNSTDPNVIIPAYLTKFSITHASAKNNNIKQYSDNLKMPKKPTAGFWDVGEIVLNSPPNIGKPIGWVNCYNTGINDTPNFFPYGKIEEEIDGVSRNVPNVENLDFVDLRSSSVKLTWNEPDIQNIAEYIISRDSDSGEIYIDAVNSPNTEYTVEGLEASKTYTLNIKVKDTSGNVSSGVEIQITTIADEQAPTEPTNLTTTAVKAYSFTLGWTTSIDNVLVTKYEIYQEGLKIKEVNATSTPTMSTEITNLIPGATYSFTIKAKDSAGNLSISSSPISVTMSSDGESPTVPTNLTASSITSNSFTVSWTAATDNVAVTGYNIYRNGLYVASRTGSSYTFTGLTPNTTYSITVLAYDAVQNRSAISSSLSVTTSS